MSLRRPNPEQEKAIKHKGGVLLSAGAGSGKTFVLVDHFIYLVEEFHNENTFVDDEDFEKQLKSYLKKIVLMTYTKKAAGELSLRLKDRIEEAKKPENSEYTQISPNKWDKVLIAYQSMIVTTIHGFCYRLLSQGYFPNFDVNQDIIGEVELQAKIDRLVSEWLEAQEIWQNKEDEFENGFWSNQKSLVRAFIQIFSSPELRLLWEKLDKTFLNKEEEKALAKQFLDVAHLTDLWSDEFNISFEELAEGKKKKPKWVDFYQPVLDFIRSNPIETLEDFSKYKNYFAELGKFSPMAKTSAPELALHVKDKIVELRDFSKENADDLAAYSEFKESAFHTWADQVKKLYDYVEERYQSIPGVTFSDLEYFVLKGLEDGEVAKRIGDDFQYLIIDEFQDTSEIQFDIVKKIVANDFSRIFCVGDVKQAIYGFRGGELGVFQEASESIPRNLSLVKNYRSCENIIHYNNLLFENIFPKGKGFAHADRHSVPVEFQTYPGHKKVDGNLYKRQVNIETIEKKKGLKQKELEHVEALEIIDYLKARREEFPQEKFCILYRKLTPLRFLFPELLKSGLEFSCQIKVDLEEDPLLYLFKLTVSKILNPEDQFQELLLKRLFSILKIEAEQEEVFFDLKNRANFFGLWETFKSICFQCGVANSNYENNLKLIHAICQVCYDDASEVGKRMKEYTKGNYSIEFQKGLNANNLKIMTAHASKGLEFDHVILGGIHTNGGSQGNKDSFGKMPLSFKWKAKAHQKSPFKSPHFILENLIQKEKDFSEAKRLFYVACTRAETSLTWFDINYGKGGASYSDNSWIDGIRSWEGDFQKKSYDTFEVIKNLSHNKDSALSLDEEGLSRLTNSAAFFHQDSLGLEKKIPGQSRLGLITELSVTRLASITDCPRKFYFKNIMKLSEEDLELLEVENSIEITSEKEKEEEDFVEEQFSSTQRGTEIHEAISEGILSNLIIPLRIERKKEELPVSWALEILKPYQEKYDLVSEVPIKFSVFGMMVSGTPDLLIIPKEKGNMPEVWDFKTGSGKGFDSSYWFQLKTYAFAGYELGLWDKNETVRLSLVYVDKQELKNLEFSYQEIRDALYNEWKKLNHLNQENVEHCSSCSYKDICQ